MLKVVGASWQKTRIGTYILIGAGLLVIGAFFVSYMERPEYSGTYCATAFWTKQVNFRIEYWKQQNDLVKIPKGAARICYKDSIHENGWAQMEVETQRPYPDWVQAFGAGILEGSLTWNNIYNQWVNTIQSSCEKDESSEKFCSWLRELLEKNFEKIKALAQQNGEHDHYWHQISLFISQLEGLETGYIRGAKRARSDLEEEIPFSDFLLMNAAADIQDLKIYYENYILTENEKSNDTQDSNWEQHPKNFFLPSATMLTKILQNKEDENRQLLFGHSTAGSYSSMLRIQKRYKFHFHLSPNQRSNTVPGADITFTSYPGILGSTDDFYIIKGRQVHSIVAGVGIKNENLKLWKEVDVEESIPLVGRVMAANRIAQNRKTWAKAMSRHPFTGAKQWVTVDINKLGPTPVPDEEKTLDEESHPPVHAIDQAIFQERLNRNKGLIWIIEQLPGRMHTKDVTDSFLASGNTTWVANGLPYFEEILEASGVSRENFSSDLSPAVNEELTSLESVDKYLRFHGFRGDLMGDESVAYGNIDLKLYSYNGRLRISDYHAIAGPIFMRLQHIQARAMVSKDEANDLQAHSLKENESNSFSNTDLQLNQLNSAIGDERLTVAIEDADQMAELEMITERRSVRNDMKAIALRKIGSGPFKWSDVADKISHAGHEGHPNEWNFDKVSPKWAWNS